jgi:tRNA(His) guanylyltransferase
MAKPDPFGDRLKSYETRETGRRFLPMIPTYARIDGRNFSAFTKEMQKPYDHLMSGGMIRTTEILVEKTCARIGYTQSDEISLVWLAEDPYSSIFFDNKIIKMTSILASLATAIFMDYWCSIGRDDYVADLPHFDCRVFQVPNRTEAANLFLWRERDATKNAISMAARTVYLPSEMDRKNSNELQEMLFQKGINFNMYPSHFKRGIFVRRETELQNREGIEVQRNVTRPLDMPRFNYVTNREAVIFDGEAPVIREDNDQAV